MGVVVRSLRSSIRVRVTIGAYVLLLAASVSPVFAQVSPDAGPLSGNRRSYSPTSFESIDQVTGDVTLSNADLILPAGSGIPVELGWTMDGKTGGTAFGLRGLVTQAYELVGYAWGPNGCDPNRSFSGESADNATLSIVLSGQGFEERAYYRVTPVQGDCDTQRWFETTDHILFNAETREVYYPNGLRCVIATVMSCYLPSGEGPSWRLVLTADTTPYFYCNYPPTHTVTQYVQGNQSRTVTFE